MRWTQKLSENIKRGIRSWLNVTPANPYSIQIQETMDFELNAIRNRIWYRGDSSELEHTARTRSGRTSTSFGHPSAHQAWRCVRFTPGCLGLSSGF